VKTATAITSTLAVTTILAGLVLVGGTKLVYPHSAIPTAAQPLGWQYGWECCSMRDCKDLPKGEIKATPVGWKVESTGEVIPFGDKRIKQSKDERFHRCAKGGDFSLPTSICLYVPDMGF
jgi:hypothetical protein